MATTAQSADRRCGFRLGAERAPSSGPGADAVTAHQPPQGLLARGRASPSGDLLQYYADVAPALLPHLRDRAMVMKRYPNGAAGEFFFMKRAPVAAPGVDRDLRDRARVGQRDRLPDGPGPRRRCSGWSTSAASTSTRGTRAATTSTGPTTCTSISTRSRARRSTRVRETALVVRDALEALGMPPLRRRPPARRGMHVYVPIVRGPDAEGGVDVRQGAGAGSSARAHPKLITAEYRIAKRPRGPRAGRLQPERLGPHAGVGLFGAARPRAPRSRRR